MDKNLIVAFNAMLKGKSFRLTKDARENYKKLGYFSDTWFKIIAIHCDGRIDLCGNNHTILHNEELTSLFYPIFQK
jgi:hypothetical protein